jgi:hypothetical protein
MGLKEILAAKLAATALPTPTPTPLPEIRETKVEQPADADFLTAYSLLLANPTYRDIVGMRELIRFLLEGRTYVIGTFKKIDSTELLYLYLEQDIIRIPIDLHRLFLTLGDIEMFIPQKFATNIKQIIEKSKVAKNPGRE